MVRAMKTRVTRFILYFILVLGWLYFYYEHPALQSNTPFIYQDF